MEEKKGISRRGFLKTAAAVSAALAVNPAYEKVMAATAAGVNSRKASEDAGIALPLRAQATVTEETRHTEGVKIQQPLYGDEIKGAVAATHCGGC